MKRHQESKETPEMEAGYHSKSFLKRATKLADKHLGKGRKGKGKKSKKAAKKRG